MTRDRRKKNGAIALLASLLSGATLILGAPAWAPAAAVSDDLTSPQAEAAVDGRRGSSLWIEQDRPGPVFALLGHGQPAQPFPELEAEFFLDWTHCQIHRNGEQGVIEMRLPGTITSSAPVAWILSTSAPIPQGQAILYFVEDVLGRTGPEYGADVPLHWEISLDGGPFVPMTVLPDNSLTTTFPPGTHGFELVISGESPGPLDDGYYWLSLEQGLVPVL